VTPENAKTQSWVAETVWQRIPGRRTRNSETPTTITVQSIIMRWRRLGQKIQPRKFHGYFKEFVINIWQSPGHKETELITFIHIVRTDDMSRAALCEDRKNIKKWMKSQEICQRLNTSSATCSRRTVLDNMRPDIGVTLLWTAVDSYKISQIRVNSTYHYCSSTRMALFSQH